MKCKFCARTLTGKKKSRKPGRLGIIDIIDNLDSYTLLPDVADDAALGEYFSTELGVFDAIPEVFRYYIDTEKYGRDLRLSMDMCYTSYGTIIRD